MLFLSDNSFYNFNLASFTVSLRMFFTLFFVLFFFSKQNPNSERLLILLLLQLFQVSALVFLPLVQVEGDGQVHTSHGH